MFCFLVPNVAKPKPSIQQPRKEPSLETPKPPAASSIPAEKLAPQEIVQAPQANNQKAAALPSGDQQASAQAVSNGNATPNAAAQNAAPQVATQNNAAQNTARQDNNQNAASLALGDQQVSAQSSTQSAVAQNAAPQAAAKPSAAGLAANVEPSKQSGEFTATMPSFEELTKVPEGTSKHMLFQCFTHTHLVYFSIIDIYKCIYIRRTRNS